MGETFQLRFNNNEYTTVSIDEPINFATVDFQLSQKDKGYGRDVSFNGGEVQFEFVNYRKHYLGKLLEYNKTYGFESIVELIITTSIKTIEVIGELDFSTAVTDDLEYFKCKVIQKSSKQIVKRRKAVKVDLLSDKDVDGNTITPILVENMLMIAKPIYTNSRWEQDKDITNESAVRSYTSGRTNYKMWCRALVDYSLEDSIEPINDGSKAGVEFLKAKTTLNNVRVNISVFDCKYLLYNSSGGGNAEGYFAIRHGISFDDANAIEYKIPNTSFVFDTGGESHSYATEVSDYSIGTIPAGTYIWIYHKLYVDNSGGGYSEVKVTQSKMNIEIVAESLLADSIVSSVKLIDAMKQVIKSIAKMDVVAPAFEIGGEFYDNRLLNGNFLRKIKEEVDNNGVVKKKPFLVSLEDIEKSLMEINVDWQITDYASITKIYFGKEDDFYSDIVCGTFTNTQFSSFNKTFNPRFQINEFNYGYKTYQSLKENEELNSADVINGKSSWILANKSVENKKDISIEWVRDSFTIEQNRRKALEITTNTSSQEDNTLFIVDSKPTDSTPSFSSDVCSHAYNSGTKCVEIVGTTNLSNLPVNVGDYFEITSAILNVGKYTVSVKSGAKLELLRQNEVIALNHPTFYVVRRDGIEIDSNTQNFDYKYTNGVLELVNKSGLFAQEYLIGDIVELYNLERGFYTITFSLNLEGLAFMNLERLDEGILENVSTSFKFYPNASDTPYTSYTDEGFTNVVGIIAKDKFANLRYSIRRNIEKHWLKYLGTCNIYNREKYITNTLYDNNRYFTSTYDGLALTEKDDINTGLQRPNLSPFMYNDVIFSNVEFSDFVTIQYNIRMFKGYILTKGVNGFPLKLYPTSMKYENLSKQLTIQGEEKFASTFKPTVITYDVTDITTNSCTAGGEITSDGYTTITNKGVVWSLLQNPTIDLVTKTSLGAGASSFTSYISGLSSNTNYYVRAYGTNTNGTSYGSQITFKTKSTDYQTIDYSSSDYSVEFISFEPLIKAFYTRVLTDNGSVECPQELINILDKLNSI